MRKTIYKGPEVQELDPGQLYWNINHSFDRFMLCIIISCEFTINVELVDNAHQLAIWKGAPCHPS